MRDVTLTLPEAVAAAVLRRIEGHSRPEEAPLVNDGYDRIQAALDQQGGSDQPEVVEPGLAEPDAGQRAEDQLVDEAHARRRRRTG